MFMLTDKKTDNTVFKNKWSWIIIITMFVLMTIVFILFGELNVSQLNWLVATNGKKWGLLADGTKGFGYNDGAPMIGWEIFVIMIAILVAAIIAMVTLMLCHKMHFSSFSFIIASWAVFFTIITTGLLYPSKDAGFQWQILVRVILIFISYPVVFFPVNWILKMCFINTKYGEAYVDNLLTSEKENAKYMEEVKKTEIKRKEKEVESVELTDKDI